MATFNGERVPERIGHAKGSGAYDTFTVSNEITGYSKAAIFSKVGKQTPCILHFSPVAGERGPADAERDVRGFAIKFYTEIVACLSTTATPTAMAATATASSMPRTSDFWSNSTSR